MEETDPALREAISSALRKRSEGKVVDLSADIRRAHRLKLALQGKDPDTEDATNNLLDSLEK